MVHAAAVLSLCLSLSSLHAQDTDGDGMLNTWETAMGLNPSDASDALTDKDGDRIPNLWEHDRGTAANDAQSFPPWDAIVDPSLPANQPTEKLFTNFQDAYQSLQGGVFRSIVRVKSGYYSSGLAGQFTPKKVALIADLGPIKATLDVAAGASGINVSDDTVIDGLVVTGGYPGTSGIIPLTDVLVSCIRHGSFTTNRRLRMVTCIVRRGRHLNPDTLKADALYIENFNVGLEHCTFADNNDSWTGTPTRSFGAIRRQSGTLTIKNSIIWGRGVQVRYFGTTPPTIINSVIGTITNSTAKINSSGPWPNAASLNLTDSSRDIDPAISDLGYPTDLIIEQTGGYAVVGDMVASGTLTRDIHGQTIPIGGGYDRGAAEWQDTDADDLPDWWELHHFSDSGPPLRFNGTDGTAANLVNPIDGDAFNNYAELAYELNPNVSDGNDELIIVSDRDRDGMLDFWESEYLGGIHAMPDSDADSDGDSNLEEFLAGTNPLIHWNDMDQDGLWDTSPPGKPEYSRSEEFYFEPFVPSPLLNFLAQGYYDDFDGDGLSNGVEMRVFSTNPTEKGLLELYHELALTRGWVFPGSDFDNDGLEWAEEMTLGTDPLKEDTDGDGSDDGDDPSPTVPDVSSALTKLSQPGPPVLSLLSPANAVSL